MEKDLNNVINIIVENIGPEKIILFGSRAVGNENQDSDFDLCILKKNVKHKRKMAQKIYKMLIGIKLAVDIIVETPSNFEKLKDNPFLIYNEIYKDGKVIYERN